MADSLESIPGVGPSTAKKLRDGGYVDIESLAVAPVLELMERTGIGFALAQRIIMWAREKIGWDVVSTKELYEKRSKMLRCTTGCRSLDKLLGGGIETQSLTEFIGPYAVGKTQICFTLCVTSQLPIDKGGLDGMVVYLDTEGTFSPERVHQIAEHWGLDPQRVLENIYVGRVYTSDHQMILVDHLPEHVDMSRVKLLIVDSIISHFRFIEAFSFLKSLYEPSVWRECASIAVYTSEIFNPLKPFSIPARCYVLPSFQCV